MSTPKSRSQHAQARPGFASRSASLRFAADGKPLSLDEKTRSIEFTAATEVPTLVWDWERWELVNEVLLMSGCRLPESGRCVFLDTHSRHSVSAVIGSFRDQAIGPGKTGQELKGRSYYSNTPDGEIPYIKTVEGHVTDVSIGYEINAAVYIEEGQTVTVEGREFTGPLRVVTGWTLVELSLCPIGADENAKVRHQSGPAVPGQDAGHEQAKEQPMKKRQKSKRRKSARSANAEVLRLRAELARAQANLARAKLREAEKEEEEERDDLIDEDDDHQGSGAASGGGQDEDERNDGLDKDEERDDDDEDEERDDEDDEERDNDEDDEEKRRSRRSGRSGRSAVQRERDRISEIRSICATFGVSAEQEAKYVRKGASVDSVRKEVMALLKAQRGGPALAGGRGAAKSTIVADAERRAAKGALK